MNPRISSIVFLLFICVQNGNAQFDQDSVFNKNDLIKDLYSLKSTILESHPNPYGFCTKDEFNDAYTHAVSYLDKDRTLGDFCKTVATVLQVMKDSHSCIDYEYLQNVQLRNGLYILPLRLISLNGGIYLLQDRDELIEKGSRIVCINNVEIEQFYAEALRYACIEGDAFSAQHRLADAILPVIIGLNIELGSEVLVDVEQSEEEGMTTVIYPGYDAVRWRARRKQLDKLEFRETLSLTIDEEEKTAILKIGTFAPSDPVKFRNFIRKSFRSIEKSNISSLVIDIRDNGGGSSNLVEDVYSYLDSAGYNTPDNIIGRNSALARERAKNMITPFARFVIRTFYKKNEDVQNYLRILNLPDGEMDTVYFDQAVVRKHSQVYKGDCYLLINGLTASAAVDFTNAFRRRMRGSIVGESCLGPVTGTWGNPALYTLPNSGIKVNLSTIRYNYDRSFTYDPAPIKPNYEVHMDKLDILENEDTQVNFVKELIRKRRAE